MIKIYTHSNLSERINELINSQERMWELVEVIDFMTQKPIPSGFNVIVNNDSIKFPIDWYNVLPPYILPETILFSDKILLGIIYFKLGNLEMAENLLKEEGPLLAELLIVEALKNGNQVEADKLAVETYRSFDDYRLMHNHGVIKHYNQKSIKDQNVHYFFNSAIDDAPDEEYMSFSAKHYMNYLIDHQEYDLAEKIGNSALNQNISEFAKVEIYQSLTQVYLSRLAVPYDVLLLDKIKSTIWNAVEKYEIWGRTIEHAMALEDASYIANISESFAESLGYISKAINIYREEDLNDFYFNAFFKKGQLLFTWAQNGQVQFYKAAIDSFQEALKYFKKEDYPTVFAEIQSNLGVIYSEIPDEVKKKSLWAAISHTSFMEALSIYTKDDYPYEYSFVCNNLANALTKYPLAVHSDNYEKALYYYNEALQIRDSINFPMERTLTLLNYLEAAWKADNSGNENNKDRFDDMWTKSEEVIKLNQGENFVNTALEHQKELKKLEDLMVN
jgi:tetratricopeptide (TPR) repeat protein